MNTLIQNILVFTALIFAVGFLLKKFIYNPKKASGKSCDSDSCGCH
ncbi:FeoB-associated Cys-rich membrane protein [Winogradskyella aquimaris]|uniref:FeoB-associated Cys-rich membrane protein n=1 Tax=Winogradskyella aquimaris TaxID=864074 RepID=A0ABU5EJ71_9FLAO|nr:FeoB-associated Cys-rich membrane protein [Winogradskyella aquimaris]MDY2586390.1 FeoB-associated Cys-rich membrane protein [Winogradskyella aquimaris]